MVSSSHPFEAVISHKAAMPPPLPKIRPTARFLLRNGNRITAIYTLIHILVATIVGLSSNLLHLLAAAAIGATLGILATIIDGIVDCRQYRKALAIASDPDAVFEIDPLGYSFHVVGSNQKRAWVPFATLRDAHLLEIEPDATHRLVVRHVLPRI